MSSWAHVEAALDGILDRRWYTNHGPLARTLEAEWAEATGRKHAVAVVNPTIALIMMAEALGLAGHVLLSAFAPPRCLQALSWAGLQPRFCDIDPTTLGIDASAAEGVLNRDVCALLATPGLPAGAASALGADHGLALFGDGTHNPACAVMIDLPGVGDHAGAGCILTDDDQVAARLRNIRSSYGAGTPAAVVRTANGRLSEAQAAMALLEPAGLSCQSIHFPACLAVIGDRRWLPYGRELIVACESHVERDALACMISAAGLHHRPLAMASMATSCEVASSVAACALVVTPNLAGAPR